MTKLIKAGLTRLKKDKVFWGVIILTLLFAFFLVTRQTQVIKHTDPTKLIPIEPFLIGILLPIGLLMSVFTSMFLGTEYSDGTMRNKIIAGHSRKSIYISNLLITIIAGTITAIVYMLAVKLFGIKTFSGIEMNIYSFMFVLLDTLLIMVSYSAIFTFISMTFTNKAVSAIISILLVFTLMSMCAIIENRLGEPEYIENTEIVDGVEKTTKSKNEYYISGNERTICQLIMDITPTGQSYQLLDIENLDENKAQQLFIYSFALTMFISGIGTYIYSKKNLK